MFVVVNKLAPIFEKPTKQSGRKPEPVLTEAEIQALEVRRAFLVSGVPEELKRQKQSMFVPVTDVCSSVIWPAVSHTQQRPTVVVDSQLLFTSHCDPWSLQNCDLPWREFTAGNVSPSAPLALGTFTNVHEKAICHKAEVCFMLVILLV